VGKVKTISDYEAELKTAHLNGEEPTYSQLSNWAKLVSLTIFQSPQEWYPWTEAELGYPVLPMAKKKETKKIHIPAQTGDYIAFYKTPSSEGWIPFVIERKGGKDGKSGPHDLYGTISNKVNRTNIYEEIDRFKDDARFEAMYLIAECTYKELLEYVPAFSGRDEKGRPKRNTNHICLSVETREATIAGLYIRGCTVIFAGTRSKAIKMYKDLMRMWLMKNWKRVLFSESKLIAEDKMSLSFEVSGMKFKVAKDAVEVLS
jgi:hypothetical protein